MKKELFVEVVTDRVAPGPRGIIASKCVKATKDDIERAKIAHEWKANPHDDEKDTVFYDEAAWMYDFRKCGICDQTIALI